MAWGADPFIQYLMRNGAMGATYLDNEPPPQPAPPAEHGFVPGTDYYRAALLQRLADGMTARSYGQHPGLDHKPIDLSQYQRQQAAQQLHGLFGSAQPQVVNGMIANGPVTPDYWWTYDDPNAEPAPTPTAPGTQVPDYMRGRR
jgi:hypothetical protein